MQTASAASAPSDDQPDGARLAWLQRPVKVREPWLTDSIVAVSAPTLAVSALDGQISRSDRAGFTKIGRAHV